MVNILTADDKRRGSEVAEKLDVQNIDGSVASISLPQGVNEPDWVPEDLPPIEVIDGQHRLWAFEEEDTLQGDFELPVANDRIRAWREST